MGMKKWAVLAMLPIIAAAMSAGPALAAGPVTITGTIANYDQVKKHAGKDTGLQLLAITKDNKLTLMVRGGKLIFKTDLPNQPLPATPAFSLAYKSLEPGRYMITVQPLEGNQHTSLGVDKPNHNKFIVITPEAKGEIKIDLGKVLFPIKQGM